MECCSWSDQSIVDQYWRQHCRCINKAIDSWPTRGFILPMDLLTCANWWSPTTNLRGQNKSSRWSRKVPTEVNETRKYESDNLTHNRCISNFWFYFYLYCKFYAQRQSLFGLSDPLAAMLITAGLRCLNVWKTILTFETKIKMNTKIQKFQ